MPSCRDCARGPNGELRAVVGTSEDNGYLRPGVSLNPGEELARGSDVHGEINVINYVIENEMNTVGARIGASRPICPDCATRIEEEGALWDSPLK